MCNKDVCVYDLCDGRAMKDYWADYCPETKLTTFGGNGWFNIPQMYSEHEPTESEVSAWAHAHEVKNG